MGPGKADLLDAIVRHGRLAAAARELEMSYMRAWKLVQLLNRSFRGPLVATERGGSGHGKATLTALGVRVLRLYRGMETSSLAAMDADWKALRRMIERG